MKKILYLHGFASSGASGTVELLRRAPAEFRSSRKHSHTLHPLSERDLMRSLMFEV